MRVLHFQLTALLAWLFLLFNLERFSSPINIASFVYLFITMMAIVIILVPMFRQKPFFWSLLIGLPPYIVLREFLGYPIDASQLPIIVTEVCALGITIMLIRLIGQGLDEVQDVITNCTIGDLKKGTEDFDLGQGSLYQEIQRARLFRRPASVLAIKPFTQKPQTIPENIIREAQNNILSQYVSARTAGLLKGTLRSCDLIIQRDDHFIVLLPETNGENARKTICKLAEAAKAKLSIDFHVGVSTFPEEAVTIGKLLELAEEGLLEKQIHGTVHPTSTYSSSFTNGEMPLQPKGVFSLNPKPIK